MNQDLMIARGQYVTLEMEKQKILDEIAVFSRSIKALSIRLDHYTPPYPGIDNAADLLQESSTAIAKLIVLQKRVIEVIAEMERIKPMTGM